MARKEKPTPERKPRNLESAVAEVSITKGYMEKMLSQFYKNLHKDLYNELKEEFKKDRSYLEKKIGDKLDKRYEDFLKKYERASKGIEKYIKTLNEYGRQGLPTKEILNSPTMEHYKYAVVYLNELKAGMNAIKKAERDVREWFDKYGMPIGGLFGSVKRERALIELGKYKEKAKNEFYEATGDVYKKGTATAIILAFAASTLLALSTANITGFAIANKTIESVYPVSAGFILLIIALFLLLKNPKRKPRK